MNRSDSITSAVRKPSPHPVRTFSGPSGAGVFIVLAILGLLVLLSSAQAEQKTIRILHINDFHGFAEPYKAIGSDRLLGGAACLAARINQFRADTNVPALFLAAGDMIQGNNWANLTQGQSVIELLNLMKVDAMVIGNHEMDFGQEVLKKRISEARFPVLGANVAGMPELKPWVLLNAGGIRVAVLGVVTEDTPIASNPVNMTGLNFATPRETVLKYLPEIKKAADVVILLSHLGYPNDRRLAEQAGGIDAIVGGHSHTRVDSPTPVNNTIVVQAWEHGKALGILDITLEDGKVVKASGRLEEIDPAREMHDTHVALLVQKYSAMVDARLNAEIGTALCDLDGGNVRKRETNLGDLVADIIRETAGADAALINGGSIRTSILKGTIRVKDVYSVLPFNNYIVAIRLKGSLLREAIEHAVSGNEQDSPGAFPQISGIRFGYDPTLPPGRRVKDIQIGGAPMDPEKEYTVATQDFIVAGGDGFKAFGDAIRSSKDFAEVGGALKGEKLVFNDSTRWLRDVVVDYIRNHKEINPREEGRINRL
jgi:2',3'-cyclic-nucleotide 2'-phosphodiesterase (5'-nucleotidase family)